MKSAGKSLLCLLLCALVTAPAALAGGRPVVSVTTGVDKLVLGKDKSATLTIRVLSPGGEPIPGASFHVRASAGRIESVTPSGPGQVTATYLAPEKFFPQQAIISAVAQTADGCHHGWMVLPLWGTGKADVRTRRRAKTSIRIGDQTFGPVRADPRGRAKIPIVVPPGIHYGKSGRRRIDLKLPPIKLISLDADRHRLAVDTQGSHRIRVYAITEKGEPAVGKSIILQADRGSLTPPLPAEPGVYVSEYTAPSEIGSSRVTISASLKGAPASRDTLTLDLVPGAPAKLLLTASPKSHTAGSEKPIRVEVSILDSAGNPSPEIPTLESSLGSIGDPSPSQLGHFVATLQIPSSFGNADRLRIRASVPGGLQAETFIDLRPAKPDRIQFGQSPGRLLADGRSATPIELQVVDPFGNPVRGVDLQLRASEGTIGNVSANASGLYTAPYTPPLRRTPGRAELQASSPALPGLVGRHGIDLGARPYLITLSAQIGYLNNLGHLSTPYFSAELGLNLPFLSPALYLLMESGYYFSNQEDPLLDIESSLGMMPFVASVAYQLTLNERFQLTFSAGGGIVYTTSSTSVAGQPTLESSSLAGCLHGTLGAGLRLGPGTATLQLRYSHTGSAGIDEVSGNLGGLAVLLGYRLGLL